MILSNRIIHSDNGTLKDLSIELNDHKQGTKVINYTTAEDFIYLASDLPFNHRWFEVSVINSVSAKPKIEIWDGNEWKQAVEVIDQTAAWSKSGIISWTIDKDDSWLRDDTNFNSSTIIGLETVKIYDLYWVRLSWDATLTVTTALKYVGHKFSIENDLDGMYPQLTTTNAKDQFQTGKTNWIDQEFEAALELVQDLRSQKVIISSNQILDWNMFRKASVHKVAEIIYRGYGHDSVEDKRSARKAYKDALDVEFANLDINRNARLDPQERFNGQGNMFR